MDGILVVDKGPGMTSHDVVRRLRKLTGQRRVGHLGTLDPLATGVLPMILGRYTRLAQFFTGHDRAYRAVIHFGFSTDSYDAQGAGVTANVAVELDHGRVEAALDRYRGTFAQMPPAVSAKKVDGVRAYKLARNKKPVELKPVEVTVYSLTLLAVDGCRATIAMSCSAGTYVRSLAHDLGQDLGCGAHIEALRRTSMGEFREDSAYPLDELSRMADTGRLQEALHPALRLLPQIPAYRVDEPTAGKISHGRDFRISPFRQDSDAPLIKAVDRAGRIVAIGEARMPRLYHPIVVL